MLDTSERARLAAALFARGVAMFVFAAVAIRWPDTTLFFALVGAGASAAVLGVFQLGMHIASRELPSTKAFMLGDGFTTLALGTVLMTMPLIGARAGLLLGVAWMFVYVMSLVLLAARLWLMTPVRHVLLSWATVTLIVALAALFAGPMSVASALYWAAAYAWCYALLHVAAGVWLHRRQRFMTRIAPRHPHRVTHHVAAR